MATFLAIHGAWHGGWAWEPLRPALEAAGHRLLAPTLPGVESADLDALSRCTLEGWAEFTADLARQQAEPVILCGHSRGGIVISEAAERAPEAISSLVYVTAFLIPAGRSLTDMTEEVPRNPVFNAGTSVLGEGVALDLTPDAATYTFYHLCSPEQQDFARLRLVPEPIPPLVAKLAVTPGRYGSVPRHYIECTEDRAIPLHQQRSMQAALPCASTVTLPSDHSPFFCQTEALGEALLRIAAESN